MDREKAIEFLKKNQPMPSDELLDNNKIDEFDEVRKYFINHPDPSCIPLFIHSFGEGSGFGVYQLCDDVFEKYSIEEMIPHLISGLKSKSKGVRYWASQFSMDFPDVRLLGTLIDLVNSEIESGTRYFSSATIGLIYEQTKNETARSFIDQRLHVEKDKDILEVLSEHKT